MSSREINTAWGLAAALVIAAVLAFWSSLGETKAVFRRAPIAVIGSSAMLYAVPQSGRGSTSLLGDGRRHWRVGVSAISEDNTLTLFQIAIAEKPEVILLEASPLIFSFANQQEEGSCSQPARDLRRSLKQAQLWTTDRFAHVTGLPWRLDDIGEPANLDQPMKIDNELLGRLYPLHFRGPCRLAEWDTAFARARAQHTQVAIVVPPRSNAAEAMLGPAGRTQLFSRAQDLASRYDAGLILPTDAWRDEDFVDHAHVGRRGRAHFQRLARNWRLSLP